MPFIRLDAAFAPNIPNLQVCVQTPAGKKITVRMELDGYARRAVAKQSADDFCLLEVPKLHSAALVAGYNDLQACEGKRRVR